MSTSTSILTRWPTPRAESLQRFGDAAGGGDMVVLDQHRIVEAEAVVDAAAGPDRVFLEGRAIRASSCACRQCARPCPRPPSTIGSGQRGDAAQAVEEVERGPLAGEQRARLARDRGDGAAGCDLAAVLDDAREA